MNITNERLAITGLGIISPIGIGNEEFSQGLINKKSGIKVLDNNNIPIEKAGVIQEYNIKDFLGTKGTRSLDRTTALTISSIKYAIESCGLEIESEPSIGLILGTSTGSIKSIINFLKETFTNKKPYLVNPTEFPNTVMNCAASQSAIWYNLKGINTTVSGGRLSGISALRYANITINKGYSDILFVGCVEEFNEYTSWAYFHNKPKEWWNTHFIGEGCVIFVVENYQQALEKKRKIFAEMIGCKIVSSYSKKNRCNNEKVNCLVNIIEDLLKKANIGSNQIWLISKSGIMNSNSLDIENKALEKVFKTQMPDFQLSIGDLIGDTFSASIGFQIFSAISLYKKNNIKLPKYALITGVSNSGQVACALFKIGDNK